MNIKIYIISYNRLTTLRRSVNSYIKLDEIKYKNISIIDTGSTYEPLLNYYEELLGLGVEITFSKKLLKGPEELNNVANIINTKNQFANLDYYVVTDPDISLENSPSNTLKVYISVLNNLKDIEIVGPMLRIQDIPAEYTARDLCWERHVAQFWNKTPIKLLISLIGINGENTPIDIFYQRARIDTTFGLLHGSTKYKRLLDGARLYNPYEALHLDWYFTAQNIPEDQLKYIETCNLNISHWAPWMLLKYKNDTLSKFKIQTVERDIDGIYKIYEQELNNHINKPLTPLT